MKKLTVLPFLLIATAIYGQTPASLELAQRVPIADVHMHVYSNGYSAGPSYYRDQMIKNNVQWAGGVGDYQTYLAEALGNRYISAMGQSDWLTVKRESVLVDPDHFKGMFARAEEMFRAGILKGFGEIHSDNHTSGPMEIRRQVRLRSPVVEGMYAMANRYDAYVQVHAQYDADFEADIYYMSRTYPRVLTVLSHCLPKSNPEHLDKIFTDLPNVVCEVSGMNGPVHSGSFRKPRIYSKEGVREEWAQLIKKHPDRVMLGTDPCCRLDSRYSEMIEDLRTMFLPYFEPDVIEKLAYKNAVRWFKLDGPKKD